MKILWCHEVSYLDKPVYEYQDFPERLAARGHEVEVIDFTETVRVLAGSVPVSRTGEGTVTLTAIPHGNCPGLKYIEARGRFRRMLIERLDRGDIDAVFVYSVFINGTQTVDLCRRYGIPVVYRVLDAYHRLRPGLLTRAILRRGERHIYRNADRVLVTNERMADYVREIAEQETGPKTSVLNHGVDTGHFHPREPDAVLGQRYDITTIDDVALFLGTTYGFSGLDGIIDRLPSILQRLPNFKLIIVGAGELDERLRESVARLDASDRVHLTGMIPYAEVPAYLSLANLALNPFAINDITRDIIPIKLLQYLASGLPVLSTPLPDVKRKFPLAISGITYTASDAHDGFVDAMLTMLEDRPALLRQGLNGLEFVTQNYSVCTAIDGLEAVFAHLTEKKVKR